MRTVRRPLRILWVAGGAVKNGGTSGHGSRCGWPRGLALQKRPQCLREDYRVAHEIAATEANKNQAIILIAREVATRMHDSIVEGF